MPPKKRKEMTAEELKKSDDEARQAWEEGIKNLRDIAKNIENNVGGYRYNLDKFSAAVSGNNSVQAVEVLDELLDDDFFDGCMGVSGEISEIITRQAHIITEYPNSELAVGVIKNLQILAERGVMGEPDGLNRESELIAEIYNVLPHLKEPTFSGPDYSGPD
jgi:hypothetical protein